MSKYLYFKKNTNILAMISDKKIEVGDNLVERKMDLTDDKLEEIKKGELTQWRNGKLKIKKRKEDEITAIQKEINKDGVNSDNVNKLINTLLK